MRFGILLALLFIITACKSPEVDSDANDSSAETPVSSLDIDTNETFVPSKSLDDTVTINSNGTDTESSPSSPTSLPEDQNVGDPFSPVNGRNAGDDDCDGAGVRIVQRTRLTTPTFKDIKVDESVEIALILAVDAQGKVVSANHNKAKTTTTDQVLINRVISKVKEQVKYMPESGAPITKVKLDVKIHPH